MTEPPRPPQESSQSTPTVAQNTDTHTPSPTVTSAAETLKKKLAKTRSEVWEHFTKFTDEHGDLKGRCNYCPKVYCCDSKKYGTSTLKNHMLNCLGNPLNVDPSQPQVCLKPREGEPTSSSMSCWKFDQDLCRKKLVKMIVVDELPFKHVEGEGFRDFVENLQPKFKIPSRWTISRDIHQLYLDEREKLQDYFKKSGVSVSITTDTWTSNQKLNYMCITGHYVDSNWKLHKHILTFCPVDSHKGEDMGRYIDGSLREWGIARVFAVVVDNVSSNETCVNYLKTRLSLRGVDVVKGANLHMRCTAHILNLIVGDGLKVINISIKRVREAVRFVRNSPARLAKFKECCKEGAIDSTKMLCLDVATRWNSTYLMLSVALNFATAFLLYESVDPVFVKDLKDGPPRAADWEVVKSFIDVLGVFYEVTLRVSASLHVTSHLAFHDIDLIGNMLKDLIVSSNAPIKAMAVEMQAKYEKYWGDVHKINKLLFIAVVVDPRYKMTFIDYYFRAEYGDYESSKLALDVKMALDELYEHYQALHKPPSSATSAVPQDVETPPPLAKRLKYARQEHFKKQITQAGGIELKNDLDVYLSEKNLTNEKDDFDILKWWDTNQCRFPVLSHLAKDVLAFPITTVPSECAFSAGGRVLDDFRSSLGPKTVEALLCCQDWLRNSPHMVVIEEDLDSIQKHEEALEMEKEKGKEKEKESQSTVDLATT